MTRAVDVTHDHSAVQLHAPPVLSKACMALAGGRLSKLSPQRVHEFEHVPDVHECAAVYYAWSSMAIMRCALELNRFRIALSAHLTCLGARSSPFEQLRCYAALATPTQPLPPVTASNDTFPER